MPKEERERRNRESKRKWKKAHPDKVREDVKLRCRRRREENAAKVNAEHLAWYHKNKERVLARRKEIAQRPENREAIKQRHREANHRYQIRHADKIAAKNHQWRMRNLERSRKKAREYSARKRLENPEATRAAQRARYRKNPDHEISKQHRRRAKILATPIHGNTLKALRRAQGNRCAAPSCGHLFSTRNRHHLDHLMPFRLGGQHQIGNVQYLCGHCNHVKAGKHPARWYAEQRELSLWLGEQAPSQ